MRLQDINNALQNIVTINTSLSEERLVFLLASAGWDQTDIRDAVVLFKNKRANGEQKKDFPSPSSIKEEEHHDELLPEVFVSHVPDLKKETFEIASPEKTEINSLSFFDKLSQWASPIKKSKNGISSKENKEEKPSSLSEAYTPKKTLPGNLPHNLPLRPYESSHATVALKEYSERFFPHIESMPRSEATLDTPSTQIQQKEIAKVEMVRPILQEPVFIPLSKETREEMKEISPLPRHIPHVEPMRVLYRDKQVVPLETQDKYVIVAALMLFLVLLLLLGYMYSNGRL